MPRIPRKTKKALNTYFGHGVPLTHKQVRKLRTLLFRILRGKMRGCKPRNRLLLQHFMALQGRV